VGITADTTININGISASATAINIGATTTGTITIGNTTGGVLEFGIPTSTTATAGTGGVLPATVQGYFVISDNGGTPRKVPFYAT
jgi:hypothetical protein